MLKRQLVSSLDASYLALPLSTAASHANDLETVRTGFTRAIPSMSFRGEET